MGGGRVLGPNFLKIKIFLNFGIRSHYTKFYRSRTTPLFLPIRYMGTKHCVARSGTELNSYESQLDISIPMTLCKQMLTRLFHSEGSQNPHFRRP